ncbi:N-acetyltransferase [Vibrio sp.]|nr:N-acetyltransferase [Vibrio sp.]
MIRTEMPTDILLLEQWYLKKNKQSEANYLTYLRENGLSTISFVALNDEGNIIGHLVFSPVLMNGEDGNWQSVSLISTHDDSDELKRELMSEGIDSLAEFGYPMVLTYDPSQIYKDVGFQLFNSRSFPHYADLYYFELVAQSLENIEAQSLESRVFTFVDESYNRH